VEKGIKKRVGRPAGKRPVIAMRIHPDLYRQLEQSAARRKIPIAEDAANRIQQSFHWDTAIGSVKKLEAQADEVIASGKESALRYWGFQPVLGRSGHWVETDKLQPEQLLALNPQLETIIERIVLSTLEKAKKK
jgi:hypothetical protein